MMFDDIPENLEKQYPCECAGCSGNVKARNDGRWECDTCDWISKLTYPTNDNKEVI
jgi:ribosomal protein L37AE/L43A